MILHRRFGFEVPRTRGPGKPRASTGRNRTTPIRIGPEKRAPSRDLPQFVDERIAVNAVIDRETDACSAIRAVRSGSVIFLFAG